MTGVETTKLGAMSVGNDKLRLLRQIPTIKFEEEMRGYSKAQVDRVLDILAPLADEIEALQVQVNEATARADEAAHRADAIAASSAHEVAPQAASPDGDFDETLRNTLLLAQRTADQTIRDAEAKAEDTRRESTAKADSIMAGARAEAKELKGEAHAQREQMLADAESERAELLADALEHAETRKSAIEEELLSEQGIRRNELLAEISQLERSRDDLNADVLRFEQFIEGRRSSIGSALEELKAVLEDPELLAEADAPEPAEIGLLDPEELTPLNVESHSIGTLSTEVDAAQQQAADFAFTEVEEDEPVYADEAVYADEPDQAEATATAEQQIPSLDDVASSEAPVGEMPDASLPDPAAFEPVSADSLAAPVYDAPDVDAFDSSADLAADTMPPPPMHDAPTPAAEFAAAIEADGSFPAADATAEQDWQPFSAEQPVDYAPSAPETPPFQPPEYVETAYADPASPVAQTTEFETPAFDTPAFDSPADPFDTGGYMEEAGTDPGIAASVTPDSVFSSVPETADPAAYSDLPAPVDQGLADPAGLGIDVESPFSEEPVADDTQAGLGGLAEQARNRLASRVSRLRDTAVPEAGDLTDESYAAPIDEPAAVAEAPSYESSLPPAPEYAEPANFPPPPEPAFDASTPAFPSDSVGGAEWSAPDPNRPMHPDAHLEDLPAADPFLDELRQRTAGEQPEGDDETLTRFLSEDGEKEGGGGWFGRRNK